MPWLISEQFHRMLFCATKLADSSVLGKLHFLMHSQHSYSTTSLFAGAKKRNRRFLSPADIHGLNVYFNLSQAWEMLWWCVYAHHLARLNFLYLGWLNQVASWHNWIWPCNLTCHWSDWFLLLSDCTGAQMSDSSEADPWQTKGLSYEADEADPWQTKGLSYEADEADPCRLRASILRLTLAD